MYTINGALYIGENPNENQLSIEIYQNEIVLYKLKKIKKKLLNKNNKKNLVEDICKLKEMFVKKNDGLFLSFSQELTEIKSKFGIVNVGGYEYFLDYNEKFEEYDRDENSYKKINEQVDKIIKDVEKIFNQKDILRDLLIDKPTTPKKKGTPNDKT